MIKQQMGGRGKGTDFFPPSLLLFVISSLCRTQRRREPPPNAHSNPKEGFNVRRCWGMERFQQSATACGENVRFKWNSSYLFPNLREGRDPQNSNCSQGKGRT